MHQCSLNARCVVALAYLYEPIKLPCPDLHQGSWCQRVAGTLMEIGGDTPGRMAPAGSGAFMAIP